MSEERITLDLIGARLLALTAAVADLQQRVSVLETRFGVMETRIGGIETRIGGVEHRLDRMIALLLRVAERIGGPPLDDRIAAVEERLRALEEQQER